MPASKVWSGPLSGGVVEAPKDHDLVAPLGAQAPIGKPLVPGSIGATPAPGGRSRDVAVALTEPVAPGDRLIVMLHLDTGEAGVYEFGTASIAEDRPVMDQGKPVAAVIVLE